MAGPISKPDPRFQRLAALPPYVLAAVDELKSRLRAEYGLDADLEPAPFDTARWISVLG